jgi:hypothetical protein
MKMLLLCHSTEQNPALQSDSRSRGYEIYDSLPPTSGGCSVGIVRLRAKATEFVC